MTGVRKILAPTDFSELSKLGLRYALEIAWDEGAEVIVYHAIDLGLDWHDRRADYGPNRVLLEESRRVLDKFFAENFTDLVEVRRVVEFGTPYKNIVEEAASEAVDMIVMSTHGRTGVDHFHFGQCGGKGSHARALPRFGDSST